MLTREDVYSEKEEYVYTPHPPPPFNEKHLSII